MKKYIKITNYFNEQTFIPRVALEKLGLSTKRDNPDTIGKFGSGIKFAPIACLRNGWEWYFVGEDSRGEYSMSYDVIREDGIDCVWHNYGDEMKPSSFTIGAGELSWTDPFQIIREPISNAMDGAKETGSVWEMSIVDDICDYEKDSFSVYITAAPELMTIVENKEAYFVCDRQPLFTYGYNKILPSYDQSLRVYCQDVLVYHDDDVKSIYDYQFDRIDLNEERTLKSQYDLFTKISFTLSRCDSSIVKNVISKIVNDDYFEGSEVISSHYTASSASIDWGEVFNNIFGPDTVILPSNSQSSSLCTALKMRGKNPKIIQSNSVFNVLSNMGIDTFESVLGTSHKYNIDFNIKDNNIFMQSLSLARIAEPGLCNEDYVFGILDDQNCGNIKGLTIPESDDKTVIVINRNHLEDSSLSDIVATFIHEYDHASTGVGDGYSEVGMAFRDLADKRIGRMIVEKFRKNPLSVSDGVLVCEPKELHQFGHDYVMHYEYSPLFNCVNFKIGDMKFSAHCESGESVGSGKVYPSFSEDASCVFYDLGVKVESVKVA